MSHILTMQNIFKGPWIHSVLQPTPNNTYVLSSKCPKTFRQVKSKQRQKETHINSISVWFSLTAYTEHVAALWEWVPWFKPSTWNLYSLMSVTLLLATVMKVVTRTSYKTSKSKNLSIKVSKAADVKAGGCCAWAQKSRHIKNHRQKSRAGLGCQVSCARGSKGLHLRAGLGLAGWVTVWWRRRSMREIRCAPPPLTALSSLVRVMLPGYPPQITSKEDILFSFGPFSSSVWPAAKSYLSDHRDTGLYTTNQLCAHHLKTHSYSQKHKEWDNGSRRKDKNSYYFAPTERFKRKQHGVYCWTVSELIVQMKCCIM